ncbi:phytochrome region-domain-containing protein [Baffinella frigidus]|nr:phytochrome region-domain-containing protein [Cryptophyta sp. CCMP2293]
MQERKAYDNSLAAQARLCELMLAKETAWLQALVQPTGTSMLAVVKHSSGGAVVFDSGQISTVGHVPAHLDIQNIIKAVVPAVEVDVVYHVDTLVNLVANADALSSCVAGCLIVSIRDSPTPFKIVWFRPEYINTVHYAGYAGAMQEPEGFMGPRTSFEAFKQIVKFMARPFSAAERASALALGSLASDMSSSDAATHGTSSLLRLNEERMRSRSDCIAMAAELTRLVDKASAPIFVLDKTGIVTQWNDTCRRITGWTLQNVAERPLAQMCTLDSRVTLQRVLQRCLGGQDTTAFELDFSSADFKASPAPVQLLLNATARKDISGDAYSVVFIGQDITSTKDALMQCQRIAEDYRDLVSNGAAPIFGMPPQP